MANDSYVVAKWKKMKTLPRVLVGCGGCILLIIIFNIFIGLIGGLIGIVAEPFTSGLDVDALFMKLVRHIFG